MGTPLRVLLVEDSENDAFLLVHALKQGGYDPEYDRVCTREDLSEALDKNSWDVVIADYLMPRFSAPDAIELIKERNPEIPIIIVSGAIGEETAVSAMRAGAQDYIMKDNLARLIPAIERELREVEIRRERCQAEEEKQKIEAQLLQAQKMEAIGRLTGGVAHDFNNLLTAIRGYADMALDELDPQTQVFNDIREIQMSADRAKNLTRQLLLFSRRQKMEFSHIDVNETIEDLLGVFHRIIGEDIEVHYDLAEEYFTVFADRTSLEQMIMNLIVNARDAMQEGGKITIRSEKVILSKKDVANIGELSAGDYVCFSIMDTGSGIDEETMAHIFEPFFTTKEFGKGSGLGLSVVYGIVQQHHGWIHVSSHVQVGSTFQVFLPLAKKKASRKSKPDLPAHIETGNGQRILVIEDEAGVRHFARRALERGNYKVFTAANDEEANRIFELEQGNLDLIFSDVVLPGVNGIKLVENLREKNPEIKIILTSGYTDQKSQWQAIREKGYPYLQKPYTFESLLKIIADIIRQA
jgi:two-component system, cell cycle sensor histidine kinase and response regulator CckA